MARTDRRGAQLAFELPPELLQRLKAYADRERRTVASLMRGWVEAGLAGALEPSAEPSAALVDMACRLEALERDVAQLQAGTIKAQRRRRPLAAAEALPLLAETTETTDSGGSADPAAPSSGWIRLPEAERDAPSSLDRGIPSASTGGAITTAELAERTGTNRAAWNNWAAKAAPGAVRHHPQAGSWRLVGKAAGPAGGPARWLWESA